MATIAAQIIVDWSLASTGALTVAKCTAALQFSSWGSEPDPTVDKDGGGTTFSKISLVDNITAAPTFPLTVTLNGTPTAIGNDTWFEYDLSSASSSESAAFKFHGYPDPTTPTRITDSLFLAFVQFNCSTVSGADFNLDHPHFYSPFAIPQQQVKTNGLNELKAHSQVGGGSTLGSGITLERNKTYFLQLWKDSTGTVYTQLHDPADAYSIVGTSSCGSDADTDQYVLYWGLRSTTAATVSGNTRWSSGVIVYNSDGLIPVADLDGGATLNVTTANFTTLNVG